MSSNDAAAYKASKPGGLLSVGSRPNLKSNVMFVTIEGGSPNALGFDKANCFGKINRKELTNDEIYHKPDRLRDHLLMLHKFGQNGTCPKLKAVEIHAKLAETRDPEDGGLMFCYSKRGSWPRDFCQLCDEEPCECNGMRPPFEMVQRFMNAQTQKKQKQQKKHDEEEAAKNKKNGAAEDAEMDK